MIQLSEAEQQKRYDEACAKVAIIREKFNEQEEKRKDIEEDFQNRCVPELKVSLQRILAEEQAGTLSMNGQDHIEKDGHVKYIRKLLEDGNFESVSRAIIRLDEVNLEARKMMTIEQQTFYFIVLLNSYLFDDYVSHCIH